MNEYVVTICPVCDAEIDLVNGNFCSHYLGSFGHGDLAEEKLILEVACQKAGVHEKELKEYPLQEAILKVPGIIHEADEIDPGVRYIFWA